MSRFFQDRVRRQRWHKVMLVLSSVVVFCTIYALILPAITLEKHAICGLEEHVHAKECYVEENGTQELVCGLEEHTHTEACFEKQESFRPTEDHVTNVTPTESPVLPNENTVEENVPLNPIAPDGTEQLQNSSGQAVDPGVVEEVPNHPDETNQETPLNVPETTIDPYPLPDENIKGSRLLYKGKNDPEFQNITPGTTLPGDATIRIEVKYENISIETLLNHNGKMTYQLPDILREPNTEGSITVGGKQVGTITAEANTLTMSFDKQWLGEQLEKKQTTLNGSFYVESAINLDKIPGGGSSNIQIGDVNINVNFDKDVIAQSAKVDLTKSVSEKIIQTEKGTFLQYELTVTAGQDGCPDVQVVDHFTAAKVVKEYVGITSTKEILSEEVEPSIKPRETITSGKNHGSIYLGNAPTQEIPIPEENSSSITAPGSFVWVIGTMDKNEIRTLTYQVELKEKTKLNGEAIQNEAVVYSKKYQRAEATSPFTPIAKMGMEKGKVGKIERNEVDGSYRIHYRVWFDAPSSNNYTMTDVVLKDSLKHRTNPTQDSILPYVKYDQQSFRLYKGTKKPDENSTVVTLGADQLKWLDNGNSFELTIGQMAPGELYCMEYDVRVGVEAFAVLNGSQLNVKNRVIAQSSNTKQLQNGDLQAFNANFGVQYNHWVKKLVGDPINEEKNVSISGNIYQQTSLGKVDKMESAPSDFTVPKGSYLYTVTVNNLGDWDVSSASMKDTLGSEHMEFVGFVEVQAHDVKTNRLVETRWVKVDQQRAFDFTPQDIGFTANQYKYVFKYYAKPVQMDNVSQVMVSNNFTLSGEIGLGNAKYELTGVSARKDVVISGSRSFEAMKHSWYYEGAKSAVGQWSNGAIYWVIQVQGTSIEKGTQLKDFIPKVTPNSNLDHSYLHSDSVLGVFKGTFPDNKSFLDYSDLETVKQSGNLTELGNEYYKVNYSNSQNFSGEGNFSEVAIEMKQSLTLSPDSLYVVVKSEPQNIPLENRSWKEYKNGLATSDNGTDWAERNVTSKNLYGGENILKELGRVVSWDGKSLEDINSVKGGDIFKEYLPGPGIYTSWAIKVNYAGNLSGAYRVIDTVPEGMEVAYARLKWRGDRYNNVNEKPLLSQIPDMVKNGWEEHTITGGTDKNKTPVTSYYYTKGNQVCWEVNNLIAGKERDTSSVDCQIVCRLTDSDVLQGGVEKTFENTVSLVNPVGVEVDNDTNPVTIKTSNMSKSAVSKNDSSSIPFTIRVNELGQDLLKDATTITLLDEMSSTLKLDTTSIQVKNIKTDTFLDKSEYKASLDTMPTGSKTQILRIVLPDNLPLEITYKATVQAKPGEKVSLSNKAYWEGYTNTGGSNVEIEDFEYSVGGTVEVDHTPQVKITKNDKNDLSHFLSGAEFQMVEGKVEEGKFQVSSDEVWIGATGKNGELTFGDDPNDRDDALMSFNAVYRITETKAPDTEASGYNK